MFGMGGTEILVILIVALLFLGPDKLPDAAKTISKGIRDLKKQSRLLQNQIENDEHIGGAIRDLKSALRGDEAPVRPPVRKQPVKELEPGDEVVKVIEPPSEPTHEPIAETKPAVTLPATAGEPDPDVPTDETVDDLAAMIKPASGTVAKGSPEPDPDIAPKQKHG
jgi:sec-independent protein translocase protein TatB